MYLSRSLWSRIRRYTPYRIRNKILDRSSSKERPNWRSGSRRDTSLQSMSVTNSSCKLVKRTNYAATSVGNRIFYVQDQDRSDVEQYEVNLDKPEFRGYTLEHKQAYRQVCVFFKENMMGPGVMQISSMCCDSPDSLTNCIINTRNKARLLCPIIGLCCE